MHLNPANSDLHSVSSVMSEIDTDTDTDYTDNDEAKFVESAAMNVSPIKQDVRRKIEDILEAKRLRAEFDF